MGTIINIYPVIAAGGRQVKISKRGREAIETLNREGQIDHDKLNRPFVLRVNQNHGMDEIYVLRNNKVNAITVSPHGQKEPVLSWNKQDGYRRPLPSPLKGERNTVGARRERLRRDVGTGFGAVLQ